MDLGFKPHGHDMPVMATEGGKDKTPKKVYPSITLRGDAAKAFCAACKPGDILEGNIRVRVVEVTDAVERRQEWGGNSEPRVELELETIDLPGVDKKAAKEYDKGGESAEEAIDNYHASKRGKAAEDDEEFD